MLAGMAKFIVLLIFISLEWMCLVCDGAEMHQNLIPQSYNKHHHPGEANGNITEVQFHTSIIDMNVFESPEGNYLDVELFLSTKWLDKRLVNVSEKVFVLPMTYFEQLWRPQVFFRSATDVKLIQLPTNNELVRIYHSNLVLHMSKLNVRIPCPMNKSKFPHDFQTCKIFIESVSLSVNDLLFKWDTLPIAVGTDGLMSFDLVDSSSSSFSEKYISGTFSCLELSLTLKRKVMGYVAKLYIPLWILIILSWVSLCLDRKEMRDKATLCIGVIISMILLQTGTFHTHTELTAMDSYFMYCIFQTLTCLVVNFIAYKHQDTEKDSFGRVFSLVRFGFPLGFVIFNLAYWLMVMLT